MKLVRYTADAARSLRRHGNMAARIRRAIGEYATDQAAHANNVRPLVGSSAKRLRVGDFRVIFEETETEILVTKIGPRGSVYD
ncbi:type II toxin-antitoxin system RelE family toxin [Crenalkalicoccus roseus]|uniref:type II toxin-antitoxin system RelE family toxin n=1 Tax=Crenalkalicoccus roseus TaxID=1485588 RepID=UPI00108214F1|nr:type II toxin-antitoxin system RelE/ParE family toxin [Crenalkalicoccus roseus]